ncbi:hypothetical protein [Phreatobacter stygius]|uniref:Uncharacterized protein n=1 Tax=Phreatobacter stygius TaxID=1940610 RepID=A0A4D7AWY0_9HYPH|nr:hypothetical protein [Phreatobacter stygius]QCI66114.1 hypothetical protein E8M01_19010 [Phreatobacter stygius]
MTRFKTLALAAVAAVTLSVAAAPKAEARYFPWGAVAAGAVVGGAALAIAGSRAYAAPVYDYGDCYTARRWVDTPYGPALRRVRVCD